MHNEPKSLFQLFVPISLEILFAMLAGMVDTAMLSTVGDAAVGAVGTANTYLNVFIILFSIISSGMVAVMTQYIGAGRPGVARQACRIGALFNGGLGVALSLLLFFGAGPIASAAGVAPALQPYAVTYLQVVGGSSVFSALVPVYSSCLRAFGRTRPSMAAAVASNLLNLVLNAVFLFGFHMGVLGVAAATALSKLVNLVIVLAACRRLPAPPPDRLNGWDLSRQILRIGLPSALESALYNLSVAIIVRFVNQMDAEGLNITARTYTMTIANFSYCAAAALAQANAILAGWRIGAGRFEDCDRGTRRAAVYGILISMGTAGLFALFGRPIAGLFTTDPRVVQLVARLLVIDVLLEAGRAGNLAFGNALKTSGDAVFTTVIAVIFMFLCAVGGSWLLGLRLGWLVTGVYLSMALDECIRAVCMYLRWRSGAWKQKSLIQH